MLEHEQAFKRQNGNLGTILIVQAQVKNYVSVTADEIAPIPEEQAIEQNNYILDECLYDMTEEERQDYKDMYYNTLEFFDNSLYVDEFKYNDIYYYYDSVACGCLHNQIKQATNKYNELIELHLNEDRQSIKQASHIVKELIYFSNNKDYNLDQDIQNKAIEIIGG